MLDTHTNTDFLEDLWLDDCKCEAAHGPEIPTCSIQATHRVRVTCIPSESNLCQAAASAFPNLVAMTKTCPACLSGKTVDHWTIRPI